MEKFALLNLIKALQGFSAPANETSDKAESPPPAPSATAPEPYISAYQGMTNMLERHEAISNRVRNKR